MGAGLPDALPRHQVGPGAGTPAEFRRTDAQAWNQVRIIVSNAVEVTPDKQGRILVPATLQDAAELSGTVLLSGNIDRVELWDPVVHREKVEPGSDEMARFSHKLFG